MGRGAELPPLHLQARYSLGLGVDALLAMLEEKSRAPTALVTGSRHAVDPGSGADTRGWRTGWLLRSPQPCASH